MKLRRWCLICKIWTVDYNPNDVIGVYWLSDRCWGVKYFPKHEKDLRHYYDKLQTYIQVKIFSEQTINHNYVYCIMDCPEILLRLHGLNEVADLIFGK